MLLRDSMYAECNLLKENEIKRYLVPSLMEYPVFYGTVTDFMAILQSIDYRKFEAFSNVVDENSTNLLSKFLEYDVLVVVSD